MQVSLETTTGLQRRLTIGVPAQEVDAEVEKRIKDAAKKVKINGFRQGKVPVKVVKQRYGEGIRNEVLGDVINRTYVEALKKESINPAGMPAIDTKVNAEGKDLEYIATFEVYPKIQLMDFSTIKATKLIGSVEDSDIDKTVENLRKQHARWTQVERAAKEGDRVNINFCGRKDGEEFQGGKADNQNLVLGSKQMIPGFESGIEGMKAGEEKTIPLTFPSDYHAEELKGAAVEFDIKVNKVEEQVLPELNEDFFKIFGVDEGGEPKFREEVKSNMNRELKKAQSNKIKTEVLNQIFEKQTVDIPRALMANEINAMRQQMVQQYGGAAKNLDLRSLLPDNMFEQQAKKRVALGLIVGEIIKNNDIKVDSAKVKEAIAELAETYDDVEAVERYYATNAEARSSVEAMVLEDQVIDYILTVAQVEEKPSSFDAIIKPEEKQQQ